MSKDFPYIIPRAEPEVEENFAAQQVTKEFYDEVEVRNEFKNYCEWYKETARIHRQELERMRGELNILRWFLRRRQ